MSARSQPFKQQWQRWQTRFDALKPREQMLIAVAGAAIALMLCDQLFWTPLTRTNTQLRNGVAELKTRQAQLQSEHADVQAHLVQDPNAELQRRIDAVQVRIDAQNKRLADLTVDLIPPEKMAEVLRKVLSERRELKLIALQNDAATYAFKPSENANQTTGEDNTSAPSADTQTAANDNGHPAVVIYRHGLTLQLRGRYFDIVNYLQALEQLPWHFYWEKLDYKVDQYPMATITIKIYTLSNREGWIGA